MQKLSDYIKMGEFLVQLWRVPDDDDSTTGYAPRPYVGRPFVPHI
jgi:hypothetical protein